MTLSSVLSETAKKHPKKIGIKFRERNVTYAEMDNRAGLCAGGIYALGVGPGDRVAILMKNCPEYIIAYFSIIRAGAIAVPINTFLTPDEVIYILNDCACRLLIYDESFAGHEVRAKESIRTLNSVMFDDIPENKAEFHTGSDDDIAVFLYTSGTTGFPKGAMLTNRNLISNAQASREVMDIVHKDRFLLFLPLFHSFSFTVCVILPVLTGARIILLESVKPFSNVINSIVKDRVTVFIAVPTVYNILSRKKIPLMAKLLMKMLVKIRLCVSGAAALPESTIHAFEGKFNIPLLEGYGLTETSPVVSVNPLKGNRKPSSVGPPIPGVEAAAVDDNNNRVGTDEVGELIVRGPNIMKGYFNKQSETDEVLKDGWLYTGDMAKIDRDGYIYIVDRKKDLIIVDGMNIYPREVEDIVMELPSIEECAMVGVADGRGSEISVLYLKKIDETTVDRNEVEKYLKDRVARFKMPRRIKFIDEFPKTATGKIKKNELREWEI
ncbi:MAG: long-chain fatty acid--CoA ligase [Nitrospiraceae bacterium]|nr:MAG: long-chain fatty acid--CoA ligase [Nitrospiraceae bacterium]